WLAVEDELTRALEPSEFRILQVLCAFLHACSNKFEKFARSDETVAIEIRLPLKASQKYIGEDPVASLLTGPLSLATGGEDLYGPDSGRVFSLTTEMQEQSRKTGIYGIENVLSWDTVGKLP